ncbi:MAG: glutaredoxin 3 [Deltaproteobacteria bacterium CG11_big_fil_rev_8_21_14_0_20_45_16]|nr:MAG: glutaredoxin 3 [Deltaproteobacteria bacterium CG11_big_fil_rev_8_21_14_0_20_45_16]
MKAIKVYTKDYCPYCTRAKALLSARNLSFEEINIEGDEAFTQKLFSQTGFRTVPQIFIGEDCVGGYTELASLDQEGKLLPMVSGD